MNKRTLVQLLIERLIPEQCCELLNAIVSDSTDDATFDGYYSIPDAIGVVLP